MSGTVTHSGNTQNYSMITDKLPSYHALFAAEIEKTDYIISSGNKISLISPSGISISKIWFAGTLISYDPGMPGGFMRIADPTGGLSFYIHPKYNEYYPEAEDLVPPLFLSVTGSFEKYKNSDNPIHIILETCNIIDRKGRDSWIVSAASNLSNRLKLLHNSILSRDHEKQNATLTEAIIHYRIDQAFVFNLGETGLNALNAIKPAKDLNKDPREIILEIIVEHTGSKGVHIDDLARYSRSLGIGEDLLKETLRNLIAEDEVYQPAPGQIKLL